MGNPGEANRQADAIAAAELKCAAEDLRARLLAGPNAGLADIEQIIRLENAADRAVRKLGIKPGAAPAGPTLEQHLAKLARDERADDAEDEAADIETTGADWRAAGSALQGRCGGQPRGIAAAGARTIGDALTDDEASVDDDGDADEAMPK